MPAVIPNPAQTLKEREAIIRIAERYPDESAYKLARFIDEGTLCPDGIFVKASGKPFYGILHVLRTLGR